MPNKLTDDYLKWTLDVDGKPAINELGKLEQSTRKLEKTNKGLRVELQKMEAAGKKNTKEYKNLQAQIKHNNQTIAQGKAKMSELRKEVGLNALTMRQLQSRARELSNQLKNTTPDTPEWKKYRNELNAVKKRQQELSVSTQKAGKIFGAFKSLLPFAAVGAFAAGLRSIFNNAKETRAEFAKYEAVLKVALGSQKEANKEFDKLQKFAAKTPFQLNELTGAYVKLTNYGLQPNMEEMRQYGDLAASVGKGFDQFTEALADATQFEFERLKEFGVRSQTEGDKIKFTFKGITTEVDKNAKSVQEYLAGLGDLNGVSGSMEAISQTLGGAMSNATDATDSFFNAIGKRLEPGLVKLMGTYGRVIGRVSEWINIDTAGKINKEKRQVNNLAAVLSNTNVPLEERNIAYAKLKELQPDIVEGINTENVDLGILTRNLAEYNEQAAQKIVLAGIEKEEAKILNKQNGLRSKLLDSQTKALVGVNGALAKMNELGANDSRADLLLKELSDAIKQSDLEKIDEITTKLDSLSLTLKKDSSTALSLFGFELERFIKITFPGYSASLTNTSNALTNSIEKHGDEVKALQEKKKALQELITVEGEISNNSGDGSSTANKIPKVNVTPIFDIKEIDWDIVSEDINNELAKINEDISNSQIENEEGLNVRLEEILEEFEDKKRSIREKYNLISLDELREEELANLAKHDKYLLSEEEYQKARLGIIQKYNDLEEQENQEKRKLYEKVVNEVSKITQQSVKEGEFSFKEFSKNILMAALDHVQKMLLLHIVNITSSQLATKGFLGIATAAALSAIATATFETAKQKIAQREQGKYDVIGANDGRLYSNVPFKGRVRKSKIFPRPTIISEHGGEMVLTAPHVRNIQMNHPALLNSIMATRIPQRAEGSYPQNTITNTDNSIKTVSKLEGSINELNSQLNYMREYGVRAWITYDEFETKMATMETIKNRAKK